ncbi:MAG: coproporphyrinogen III oxidase family protein [Phycisphaeraceae bacterium]|nr:MAG: coproporphyrinogen III oxidase family protein [Phycisphaeraceae bacterium]
MQTTPISVDGQQKWASLPLSTARTPVRSLYVHIPFCFHKCHYCDFYSFVDSRDRQGVFVDRLIEEFSALARHAGGGAAADAGEADAAPALDTIFVGGGTPSLLRPDLWARLLGALRERFDLSTIDAGRGEFTVECNPETVTAELMATLAAGGVDRVSVGAQSFDQRHLVTLERHHDPENVARALALANDAGIRRRSLDLIYAIPGQTLKEWASDLDRALEADDGLEHMSCYALTYEPNTPMTKRMRRGDFEPADEGLESDMYEHTVRRLREAGFERYEVSNFAKKREAMGNGQWAMGGESSDVTTHGPLPTAHRLPVSLHNLVYWRCGQWLAAGPSASGHIVTEGGGHRWKNVPHLTEWMQGVAASGGYSPIIDHEPPDARRALAERLMMGVRIAEGLCEREMQERAEPLGAAEALQRAAAGQAELGRLSLADARWRLTDAGWLFADGVASELMAALAPGESTGRVAGDSSVRG